MDITQQLLSNKKFQELISLTEKNDEAHDLAHFMRIKKYALEIGESEKADLEILESAAMLHDIARGLEAIGKTQDHLLTGAEISKEILLQIDFPKEKIDEVTYCVSVHQRRTGVVPRTLESKIIQDADLLDTYGLIYVARSILWGVQSEKYRRPLFVDKNLDDNLYEFRNTSTIHYLLYRLTDPKYAPETLHTKLAQKIASERLYLIKEFTDKFLQEWRGEI